MVIIPPFANRCLSAAQEAWDASFDHPFVRGLIDGTLSDERFRFYQMQDARYLEAYADVCSLLSTRFSAPPDKLWFIEGAKLALVVEQSLHQDYGKALGYSADDIARLELSPSNKAYQDHMLASAASASILEALAALAPCPWLYTAIGQRVVEELDVEGLNGIPDGHPYAQWLRTYADPGFVTYTSELLAFLEREALAHGPVYQERAIRAFSVSTRYEWMFWDQAWHLQAWPV